MHHSIAHLNNKVLQPWAVLYQWCLNEVQWYQVPLGALLLVHGWLRTTTSSVMGSVWLHTRSTAAKEED